MTTGDGPALTLSRDVSGLLAWLRGCTPGTLIPAGELLERVEALPTRAAEQGRGDEEPEQLVTADEVAAWLGFDRQRVYRMVRDGRLPSVRLGANTVRFRRRYIERWIERRSA
jgi:excisionase family DNA binding protein